MFERFARNARIAVVLAQEEARELGAEEIRPEHLLVGVLQVAGRDLARVLDAHGLTVTAVRADLESRESPDDLFEEDAESLRRIGIDLYAIRDAVRRNLGPDAWDTARPPARRRRRTHIPFTRAAKKALQLALREAVAHRDSTIDCEHVLLGILRGGDSATTELITAHVDPARLRADVVALLDRAA